MPKKGWFLGGFAGLLQFWCNSAQSLLKLGRTALFEGFTLS
jgi:hypothetical protein